MVEIKKQKTQFGYSFKIMTDTGTFEIFFAGNLDLYWKYYYDGNIWEFNNSKPILITKENYFLYQLFDNLYHGVNKCIIYYNSNNDKDELFDDFFNSLYNPLELQKELYKKESFNPESLMQGNKLEWHCDDGYYDNASKFIIEPNKDSYKLTFYRSNDEFFSNFCIRIRNSGSRYDPFNILFMNMYYELCNYDYNYHQIHMEEYLYQKKMVKRKKNI